MSKSSVQKPLQERGVESLTDRFDTVLSSDGNKPDFKELDLGSPVSPLRTHVRSRSNSHPVPLPTSSSSSSSSGSVSGKTASNAAPLKPSDGGSGNHSGELSGSSEGSPTTAGSARSARNSKPGHQRSNSGGAPLIYSGGGSVNSPNANLLPSGNICPSGRAGKTVMVARGGTRSDVLGSGTGNYGHGSIMRGKSGSDAATGNIQFAGEAVMVKRAMASSDPEEVKRAGNEQYKRGNFAEALCLYDRAIVISPNNAACRSNRAAALTGLGRLAEAVRECEEAVRLDPAYGRAHQRLAALHLRLGQVENARRHLFLGQQQPDADELQKLQAIERHLKRCATARKIGDWKSAMREGDAAITAGADYSPQLFACRAEALLKLRQLEEADSALLNIPRFELSPTSSQTRSLGMFCHSYVFFVRAQVEMALGRFENAVAAAEKAGQIDPQNIEVATMLNNVRSVARARARGNDLFKSGQFAEACVAYGEGLKFDPSNPVLYCNRAACRSKLEQWERSVDDCNEALKIQPNYTKALLRRAACNSKLERWAESVHDYEVLIRELPDDKEVAEALFRAQVALKKSRGEEVYNMKFGGEVEEITGVDQFRAAVSSPGVSVIHFMVASNQQSIQMSAFFDTLCVKYPSLSFLKVDMDQTPAVSKAENVRIVPTFKIYKKGALVKEMICPSEQVLEYSLRHYSF
ncbi:TPR repeat-containing thioredoxin TTL1-like protein [Cinnamomum micranthum f. kanehirae]|uniref:TPR repeat-containing thioredoxin TTL1-like protein n=1 Tax=Cinnamomum micranthum f. kanehirae TaxID=337451 RepID=A0A3S3N5K9_9MAGN|nr:TPR repeat-containing thioredoxin TTL1-like protein [Cinnamomum micranthum f. kanehirae]